MAKDTFQIGNTEEALVSKGMGTIETIGGTASQTYTAGSYFVGNDGFMYQADTDLTTANTLVSSGTGKNCTKTDIATELEKVNSEYATLSNEVDTLSNLVEGATEITTKSFSPVIAVNDALPVNAVDVQCKIEPIQAGSGTPSPSNVRAISGRDSVKVTRAGKNLIEETYVHANIDSMGGLRVESSQDFNICVARVKKGCTYVMSINSTVTMPVYAFYTSKPINGSYSYDGNRIVGGNAYFIAPIDGYVAFRDVLNETKTQLELGSIATAYEPYTSNDYTIQLGDAYYGGTLDITTGVLTVDKRYVVIDENDSSMRLWDAPSTYYTGYTGFYTTLLVTSANSRDTVVCNICESVDHLIEGTNAYIYNNQVYVSLPTSVVGTTLDSIKAWIANNNIEIVYEIATPSAIIQLTPQEIQMLQGNNTIFTDSGDTSIQYYANGVKNLEASVSAIQNDTNDLKALTAIFGTFENGTTASKPYAQGDYFVKNNKMCKAKTSIAKGATLTLNTNYEEKTLAEILKTIETT